MFINHESAPAQKIFQLVFSGMEARGRVQDARLSGWVAFWSVDHQTRRQILTIQLLDVSTQQACADPEQPTDTSQQSIWDVTTTDQCPHDQSWNVDNFLGERDSSHMDSCLWADDGEDLQLHMDAKEGQTSRGELEANHQQGATSIIEDDIETDRHNPVEEERDHVPNEGVTDSRRDTRRPRDSRLRQRITPPQRLY